MTFSFYKDNKLKFGKLIVSTDDLVQNMQSKISLPLFKDVTFLDVQMKCDNNAKFAASYTFTLGNVCMPFVKNEMYKLLDSQFPRDIIGEICSFLCVDDYFYKFQFSHSYNCTISQNHFGSHFRHKNEFKFECMNDSKFYCLHNAWNDAHFYALLLSLTCSGYELLKKSNCIKPLKCHYFDAPFRQNMDLFIHQIGNKQFEHILNGMDLLKIDINLKGIKGAIYSKKNEKIRQKRRKRLLTTIMPCILKMF